MDDDSIERKDRYFHSADDEDGPDTVRILPESAPREEWRVEKHPVQRGTLYSPAPASAPVPPASPPHLSPDLTDEEDEDVEEIGQGNKAVQPYTDQTRQPAVRGQSAIAKQEEATTPGITQVRKGPSACSIIAATVSVLLLSCALLTFATVKSGWDGLGNLAGIIPGIWTSPTVTLDASQPAVIDQIRALSKLETVQYEIDKVVQGRYTNGWPFTEDQILLVAHGAVVAGVDLSKIKPQDIVVVSDTVTIRLPKAEVLYSKLDNDKTYIYDRRTTGFTAPDPNLETQTRQLAEKEILKAAIEDGILTKAGQNAEDVLRTLLTGLGYKKITFIQTP